MRSALLSLSLLAVGGCGLQATAPPAADPPVETASDAEAADASVEPVEPSVASRTTPREPVRAARSSVVTRGNVVVSTSGSATPDDVRSAHLTEVRRLECGDRHVDYPEQFDDWHTLDLDGDGADEHLVFFTLEGFGGGNNYLRYLAVYRYVAPVWFASYTALVGGKGSALVSGGTVRLENGVLSTAAMLPDEDDATCCPSVESELTFDVGVGATLTPRPVEISDAGEAFHWMLQFASRCG
jgi:hypothetical protein